MLKETLLLILLLFPTKNNYCQQEILEIDGAIQIRNSTDPSPDAGTIRWTGSDFEGWNGFLWVSLTGGIKAGTVNDIDGHTYKTRVIGGRVWMTENLRTGKYANGDEITSITSNNLWVVANFGAWCWYNNDNGFETPYGKLYNWYAVNDARGLCPTGWHVPTDVEWTSLTNLLGGMDIAGGIMKEMGTTHWTSPNLGATNESSFTGLPGGLRRSDDGTFTNAGNVGDWWTSTQFDGAKAWYRNLFYINESVAKASLDKHLGFSVRCIRN